MTVRLSEELVFEGQVSKNLSKRHSQSNCYWEVCINVVHLLLENCRQMWPKGFHKDATIILGQSLFFPPGFPGDASAERSGVSRGLGKRPAGPRGVRGSVQGCLGQLPGCLENLARGAWAGLGSVWDCPEGAASGVSGGAWGFLGGGAWVYMGCRFGSLWGWVGGDAFQY